MTAESKRYLSARDAAEVLYPKFQAAAAALTNSADLREDLAQEMALSLCECVGDPLNTESYWLSRAIWRAKDWLRAERARFMVSLEPFIRELDDVAEFRAHLGELERLERDE